MVDHVEVKGARVPMPPYQVWTAYLWAFYCIRHIKAIKLSYYSKVFH